MQNFLITSLCSFVGCLGFCITYNFKKNVMLLASLGGVVGWGVFLLLTPLKNNIMQYFCATVCIAVYSEIMARLYKSPVTIFLVIALLPLVPGGGVYYTMKYCVDGNIQLFIEEGLKTVFIAGALAIGIVFGITITRILQKVCHK